MAKQPAGTASGADLASEADPFWAALRVRVLELIFPVPVLLVVRCGAGYWRCRVDFRRMSPSWVMVATRFPSRV